MNVLHVFAPLALCLPFAWAQCDSMSCRAGCDSYYELCIETAGCTWDDTTDSYCESSDGQNEASCCLDAGTTPSPTLAPTCAVASASTADDPCYGLDEDCCAFGDNSIICQYAVSELCRAEGGPGCCEMITTTSSTEWEADSTTTTSTTSSTEWEADSTTTTATPCPDMSNPRTSCWMLDEECCDSATQCVFTDDACTTTSEPTAAPSTDPTTTSPTNEPTDAPTTGEPTTSPSDVPSSEPTPQPTAIPTTAAPSHPGELICGDQISGDYSGEYVAIEVRMPYDGAMTIDASGSDFEIGSIRAFNSLGTELTDTDESVLTLNDLEHGGDYFFWVDGVTGITEGEFDIVVSCSSDSPTSSPSKEPTSEPTDEPSAEPSAEPTASPSAEPSAEPTEAPSAEPTDEPTESPSADPTEAPSAEPTDEPTEAPTDEPTPIPTEEPTESPSTEPTESPSTVPTAEPSANPTTSPSDEPSTSPTPQPTALPTTAAPSHPGELICGDQISGDYSGDYVEIEVRMPHDGAITIDASGSNFEIASITAFDDEGNELTDADADESAGILTVYDLVHDGDYIFQVLGADDITEGEFNIVVSCSSDSPTAAPSKEPTSEPSSEPSGSPSNEPTASPSDEPSAEPTEAPSAEPTDEPTEAPTDEPTSEPTDTPTSDPSAEPTESPSEMPTTTPTEEPTASPSTEPTDSPTEVPTANPSTSPTPQPTALPTTAAPSHPGELICGDQISGDYSGDYVEIEVRMPHDGAMTIDASGSDFEIGSITAFDADGTELTDTDESVLTLYDLEHDGDYTFQVLGADDITEGEFDIVVSCTSDSPTAAPSKEPTSEPTDEPSAEPSDEPTASPSAEPSSEPTEAPSAEPTDEPTESPSADPTEAPSTEPTDEPTEAPTDEPTPIPTEAPTDAPTTASPTTSSPTSASPTTSNPTTASPTTSKPTTPYPTTDAPTVAEDTTTTTSYNSYPTPRPTMKSALKWEMIHPQYKGSDGELLWHVYYGDFSGDERFDGFRNNELWDADVIRPILQMDLKFERFAMASAKKGQNKQLSRSAGTPAMSSVSSAAQHSSYGVWLVLAGVVLVGAIAYWLKFKSGDSKLFNQSLLNLEAKTLLTSRNKQNECYVY